MSSTKKTPPHRPLPSRDEILAFIAREGEEARAAGRPAGKIGKREIARAFNLKGAERIEIKRLLRELRDEGVIERRRKTLHKAGDLPPVVLCDIYGRDHDGELLARPAEWDPLEQGEAPVITLTLGKGRRGEQPPGVGDRALVRSEKEGTRHGKPQYAGRIVKVLSKSAPRVVGVFRRLPNGMGRIDPIDKKRAGRELEVVAEAGLDVEDGELVAVDVLKSGRFGLPRAKIRERIGRVDNEKSIAFIALTTHDIPHEFSATALAEADAARPAALAKREDWRALPLITIDPADARDHDDAVCAAPDEDPANAGGFVLTVAIADVAAYIRPGGAMDREALDRGNSVYFPGQVVPMLPERISNDLCSLRPQEDRPALAVRMRIAGDGRKIGHSFHRIMMRSAARLAYAQAQQAIDGTPDETTGPLLEGVLRPLWQAYGALKIARDSRSPLDLDLPERKLVLNENGQIDRVTVPPRLDAHRLIEEFMILANVAAAETLEEKGQRLIYRAHDEPSLEKINALSEFLHSLGIKLNKGQMLRPQQFNTILARVRGGEHEHPVNEIVLRTQAQAEYSADNYGHFGLNLKRYAHFTSPIRRYADLIVHRALIRALNLGDGALPDVTIASLPEIAARISAAERRAMKAERETTDRLIAHFLASQIGATFSGRIAGVIRAGLFVKLDETGADGFIPASTLGRERYHYDEAAHTLSAGRGGETFRIGAPLEVRLMEASPLAGALRFELVGKRGATARSAGASRGAGGRPQPSRSRRR